MSLLVNEEVVKAYNELIEETKKYSDPIRVERLLALYSDYEERIKTAPASGKLNFHFAFSGGWLLHTMRVLQCTRYMSKLYAKMDGWVDYTDEELIFAAIHHDLGKLGLIESPYYIPQESEWHKNNRLEIYQHNDNAQFMKVNDLSFFILQKYGVVYTAKEMLGIKLANGLYDKESEDYLIKYGPGHYPMRTNLPNIVHWADHMATSAENDQTKQKYIESHIG